MSVPGGKTRRAAFPTHYEPRSRWLNWHEEIVPIAFGAYIPDALWKPEVLVKYAAAIRRKPDFLLWSASWADGGFGDEQRKILKTLDAWDAVPVIAWDPMDYSGPPVDQPLHKLSNIKIATGLETVDPGVVEPTAASVDWRADSSATSLAAFTAAVTSPYYQGSLRAMLNESLK